MRLIEQDKLRYSNQRLPLFQFFFRKAQEKHNPLLHIFYRLLFRILVLMRHIDISSSCKIGGGLYFGHAYGITINPKAILGRNINIHKGVTIGQENRGSRKGTPIIKNNVWIGVNSTIVGNVIIGSDVMIAPNSFVNCDVPSHSIVFGNPCIIKHKDNATEGYINDIVE